MYACMHVRGERVILSHRIRGILENVFSRRREQRFYMLGTMRLCWNLQLPPPRKFDDFWGGIVALAKPVVSRRRERRFWCVTKKHKFDFPFFCHFHWGRKWTWICVFVCFHLSAISHPPHMKAFLRHHCSFPHFVYFFEALLQNSARNTLQK